MNYKAILKPILISVLILNAGCSFAACSSDEIKNIRASALSSYNKTDYISAESKLSNYYNENCSFYNMAKESDTIFNSSLWLISDLMFYREKLNDQLGCLALGDDVYWSWMISDPERHEAKVEKSLQTNINQCRHSLDKLYSVPAKCPVKGYDKMYAIPASWQEQNEMFYEVACIKFVENATNLVSEQRDLPKFQSEGMNAIAKFEVLYVSEVSQNINNSRSENSGLKHYQLDPVYLTTDNGLLWGSRYCYSFKLRFGKDAGIIFLDGSSRVCSRGSATFINRVIAKLDYPLRARIIDERSHTVK